MKGLTAASLTSMILKVSLLKSAANSMGIIEERDAIIILLHRLETNSPEQHVLELTHLLQKRMGQVDDLPLPLGPTTRSTWTLLAIWFLKK